MDFFDGHLVDKSEEFEVFLNIYDLHTLNNVVNFCGMGVYHSGVEIAGTEYSYGGHDFGFTGVFDCEPKRAPDAIFRYSLSYGRIHKSRREIRKILDKLSDKYAGNTYNSLARNCNDFSEEFLFLLTGKKAPSYVNRLARIGLAIECFLPKDLFGLVMPTAEDESHLLSNTDDQADFYAFSGPGNKLGTSEKSFNSMSSPEAPLLKNSKNENENEKGKETGPKQRLSHRESILSDIKTKERLEASPETQI